MKKGMLLFCSVVCLLMLQPVLATKPGNGTPDGGLQVLCSPDLNPVMQECLAAYARDGAKAGLEVLADQQVNEWVSQPGHIALLTKYHMDRVDPKQSRVFVIGREVYVPVVHPENPYLDQIRQQGISPREFALFYAAGQQVKWGALLQDGSSGVVHAYRTSDPSFTSYLADFASMDPGMVEGNILESCEQVVEAVAHDRYGIGFCTLSQLKNMQEQGGLQQLAMVPVDLNDNNRMDHIESIYGNVDELYRGIWIGKYAGSLYSRIFAVVPGGSLGTPEQQFLSWLVGEGQQVLAQAGYSALLDNEQAAILASLDRGPVVAEEAAGEDRAGLALVIAAIVLGLGIVAYLVFLAFNDKMPSPEAVREAGSTGFVAASSEVPGGYYFDRSHTWAFQERDGNIRIGLDSFIEKLTGPITKIEMKHRGEQVRKGRTVFTLVQNGKRMDIKSPVSGKILSQNEKLRLNAGLINNSPFSEGWVYMIEPTHWAEETETFFRASKYREWIKSEVARLKDFLARFRQPAGSPLVVLQEGGEISDGILKDLGPEVWDDFQTDFLRN